MMSDNHSPEETAAVAPVESHPQGPSNASVGVDSPEESMGMAAPGHPMPPVTPPVATEAVAPVTAHPQELSDGSVDMSGLEEDLDKTILGHAMPPLTPPAATEAAVPVASHAQKPSGASVDMAKLEESLDMAGLGHQMPPPTPSAATGAELGTIPEEHKDDAPSPSETARGKQRAIDTAEVEDKPDHVATDGDNGAAWRAAKIALDQSMAQAPLASDLADAGAEPISEEDEADAPAPASSGKGKEKEKALNTGEAEVEPADAAPADDAGSGHEAQTSPHESMAPLASDLPEAVPEAILEEGEGEADVPVLSEKAKGKQRAKDPDGVEDGPGDVEPDDDDAASGRAAQIAHDEGMARELAARDPAEEIRDDVAPPSQTGTAVVRGAGLGPSDWNFLARTTDLIPLRNAPVAWWEKTLIVDGISRRDDAQFISMLRQPLPEGDGRSVLDMLTDGQTALATALDPAGRNLADGDLRDALRIQEVGMRWIEAQQKLLKQLKGETSLSLLQSALYGVQALILSGLPFVVAGLPTPKNGAYLAGATAAGLRYTYQMMGLLRLETVDGRTMTDSLVNRQWTWAANPLLLLLPTVAEKKGAHIEGKKGTLLELGVAAGDVLALLGLEHRAKLYEGIFHYKSRGVRAGKVGLPLAEHAQVQNGLRDVRAGIDALQALRKTFEESNFRITGGLSSQLSHLLTDQQSLEDMLQSSMKAVVGSQADIEARASTGGEGSRVGLPQGLMVRLQAINDAKRKLVLMAIAVGLQAFQVILYTKNAALLPDYLAYLIVVTSTMFKAVTNPANEYQDVEGTFLDYNAGSVVGLPQTIANFAAPAQLEIGGPEHSLGFGLWTVYLFAANFFISPFVGAWLSAALAAMMGGVTTAFTALAAYYNELKTMQPGDALPVTPQFVEMDFHSEVANAPAEEVERLTPLIGLGTAMGHEADAELRRRPPRVGSEGAPSDAP